MKIILGSSSRFRKKVLDDARIEYESISPDIHEKGIRALDPMDIPLVLSFAKSQAVIKKLKEDAIVITCDQIVFCNEKVLEKPISADEVREWFKMYFFHQIYFINGITVFNTKNQKSLTGREITTAKLMAIPEELTERLIKKGIVFENSGGIYLEDLEEYCIIQEGTKDSIIGLPLNFVLGMIEKIK